MRVSDFNYNLPEYLIAQYPPAERGNSCLLVLDRNKGSTTHKRYMNFADYVSPGDVVVLNDTKVIKARLIARNTAGQKREFLLLEKHSNDQDWHTHKALYRGKIRRNEKLKVNGTAVEVATIEDGGLAVLRCEQDLFELAEQVGRVPLPPYVKRTATAEDVQRYQTEFAHAPGSVAAPTASLNFTKELVRAVKARGAKVVYLTLHVGMGTFLPIRTDSLEDHKMHEEYFHIPKETVATIQAARATGNKIIAVGTTVTRTLEYCASQILDQEPQNLSGEADIFIYPGYEFQVVDSLLTNFHAPKTTVLMLAAAFAGWDNLRHAYEEAIKEKYAFLSYGDSMLIV